VPLLSGSSRRHGQQPVTVIRGFLDCQELPLDEIDQRDRDVPHDDAAEDDDARLPGAEPLRYRWNVVHLLRPPNEAEEGIR
jgi:hypothetical protein